MMNKFNIGVYLALMLVASLLVSCDEDQDDPLVLDPCECYDILSKGMESNVLYDTCNQALHVNDQFIRSYTKCQYAAITGADTADVVIPVNKTPDVVIPTDGTYSILLDESEVRFVGRNSLLGKKQKARFRFSEGTIVVKDSSILEATFVVDLKSIEETSKMDESSKEKFIKHFLSEDFLEAEKYPTATFELTGTNHGTFKLDIQGMLTIKGVSHEVDFHTSLIGNSNDELTVGGSFLINRTDFGVNYNSGSIFSDLGDEVIDDKVPVAFNIKAVKISE